MKCTSYATMKVYNHEKKYLRFYDVKGSTLEEILFIIRQMSVKIE